MDGPDWLRARIPAHIEEVNAITRPLGWQLAPYLTEHEHHLLDHHYRTRCPECQPIIERINAGVDLPDRWQITHEAF